ncbi:MAG: hypothetical protein JXB15_00875 [Anaerolineales bacterium]|nr:hypothetical protein [Anaerolineales bacterium]
MKRLKRVLISSCMIMLLFASACSSLTAEAKPVLPATPTAEPAPEGEQVEVGETAADGEAVLLFGIGMHIEPFGSTPSTLAVGELPEKPKPQAGEERRKGDYNVPQYFERHVQDIQTMADIVEAHGGRMTVQAQTPFTQAAIDNQNGILADLAQAGHEMALHFHEDAHMGDNSSRLPVETWCAVMKEEIALIEQASGVDEVLYWSGGNLYPDIFEAAACAGLQVNSDWKNPQTQSTPDELMGVNPWRPAGGTDGYDLSQITRHDPQGEIVFLPEGQFSRNDFASMRRAEGTGGDQAYFEFLAQSLRDSLAAAQVDKVNVFHFTVHPTEFRGDPEHPFEVIDRFLAEVVDPLVASGQVRWATFSEMAEAYQAWEQANPGVDPRGQASTVDPVVQPTAAVWEQLPAGENSAGYITFAINVHDWVHSDESAATLLKLVDLFEKYGVSGDFYFTAPVVEAYAQDYPQVIERLKNSEMTISYHVRPPHPLYTGFDQRLQGLDDQALYQAVLDYETYGLDLATGDLDRSRPGGYTYVAQVFGRNPVVASAPSSDPRVKQTAQRVYADLGAQMAVMYHEEGTDPAKPFEYIQGLLVRPSDFSVTRTTLVNGSENFWWNFMSAPDAERCYPISILEAGLAKWEQSGNERLPFITALIHENNFYRSGPEAWTSIYYTVEKGKKSTPLTPPFDLGADDPSKPRSAADQAAIWEAYEQLVAFAAKHLQVVTSSDIVQLAQAAGG